MAIKIGGTVKNPTTVGLYDLGIDKNEIGFGNGSSGNGGSSSVKSTSSDEDVLSAYINDMYGRFAPQQVDYTAKSEEEIRDSVAAWLRPSYDQAISNRQQQTQQYKANLDADAISRGMGASTYVTDVKNRQQNAEAGDIATLEADYGSTLAKYVLDGADSERERQLEAEQYNATQRQNAYDQAYTAALALFEQYKKRAQTSSSGSSTSAAATTLENCEAFLGSLSGSERKAVYEASTAQGAQYRAELIASVGTKGYIQLMGQYPSTP